MYTPWPARPVNSRSVMTSSPRESTVSTRPVSALALVRRVVDVHVVGLGGDDLLGVRVVDDDVGVGARGDGALLRVQAEHPGRGGAGDLDPAAAARCARRRRPGGAGPSGSRRPAGRWGSSRSRRGPAPSGPRSRTGSGRWRRPGGRWSAGPCHSAAWCSLGRSGVRAHVLRALEVRLGEVVGGQEQVLRAGLAEDVQPLVARAAPARRPPPCAETCTTYSGAPATWASLMARWVASASSRALRTSPW